MVAWGTTENDESLVERFLGVTASFLAWSILYKLQSLTANQPKSPEWRCRVVTFVHGILVVILGTYSQIVEGPHFFSTGPGMPVNETQMTITKICFGYFLFDITWCLYYQTEPYVMLIHHMVSLFGLFCTTIAQKWGTELVAVIAGTELTNPILQMRWFVKESGGGGGCMFTVIDAIFTLLFGAIRLILGTVMTVYYVRHPQPDFLGRMGAFLIYGLGWVFYYYILSYAFKKYLKRYIGNRVQSNGLGAVSNGHSGDGTQSRAKQS